MCEATRTAESTRTAVPLAQSLDLRAEGPPAEGPPAEGPPADGLLAEGLLAEGLPAAVESGGHDRVTVTASAWPAAGRLRARYSTDVIRLRRAGGQVTGSVRVPADPTGPAQAHRCDLAARLLEGVERLLPAARPWRVQSLMVTVRARLHVLARLETPAGPVLMGGGASALADVLARPGDHPGLDADPQDTEPAGWRDRPLVLQPPVAGAVLGAVRHVLGSRSADRLDGRLLFPPLTLTDVPVEHAEGEPDDAGHPAQPWTLLRQGRVAVLPRDPATGLPLGRAVWAHDRGQLVAPESSLLIVGDLPVPGDGSGPPGPRPAASAAPGAPGASAAPGLPAEGIDLLLCVEGLRRYHPDGRLRLACLARPRGGGPAFLVGLSARPLSLLRAVRSTGGRRRAVTSEQTVLTPSLVLPPARSLERSSDVRIGTL